MNRVQRALRPVVNFVVETFFPKHLFWGKEADPFRAMERVVEKDKKGRSAAMIAAHVIVADVRDMGGSHGVFTLTGVSKSGVPLGDWRITVEKLPEGYTEEGHD